MNYEVMVTANGKKWISTSNWVVGSRTVVSRMANQNLRKCLGSSLWQKEFKLHQSIACEKAVGVFPAAFLLQSTLDLRQNNFCLNRLIQSVFSEFSVGWLYPSRHSGVMIISFLQLGHWYISHPVHRKQLLQLLLIRPETPRHFLGPQNIAAQKPLATDVHWSCVGA